MVIIKPRINDFYNLSFTQNEVDFAIPFLDSDIPLYIDPFLLWKSPSQMDKSLHLSIISSFNSLGKAYCEGDRNSIDILNALSECNEIGLGNSVNKNGRKIGNTKAEEILRLFIDVDNINKYGLKHFEAIQLLVDDISVDRISDISANLIKSFLIDYTIEQSKKLNIPMDDVTVENLYNFEHNCLEYETVKLPINPYNKKPILFVPKRFLRYKPWISYDDFFSNYYIDNIDDLIKEKRMPRAKILEYNRKNFGFVEKYLEAKQIKNEECNVDFIFKQLPETLIQARQKQLTSINTGKSENADKKYEETIVKILPSLFYPDLDYATEQSRTDGGTHIRDMIFYNNRNIDFLQEIHKEYGSTQIVFELKNVKELDGSHINQLSRYLPDHFGSFGIIVTRNPIKKAIQKNIIDLWSAHRKCILVVTDQEIELMVKLYKINDDRKPLDVIKKLFIDFKRMLPN